MDEKKVLNLLLNQTKNFAQTGFGQTGFGRECEKIAAIPVKSFPIKNPDWLLCGSWFRCGLGSNEDERMHTTEARNVSLACEFLVSDGPEKKASGGQH